MTLLEVTLFYVNTLMMQQVLAEPEGQGRLTTADLWALTPLLWQLVNPYGTFQLNMSGATATHRGLSVQFAPDDSFAR